MKLYLILFSFFIFSLNIYSVNNLNIIKCISKVDSLRLRESPNQSSKTLTNITKSNLLRVHGIGPEEIINGIKGNWIKVSTNNYFKG